MKATGRRAWRKAAKKLRCKMGRRWRSQQEWVHGKRWSELVPDLEAHRAHIAGSWFKRHGVTEQGLEKLDAPHLVRVYVGLWGTVDGDYVKYAVKPEPFTTRSLVGMTQGARKRRWARDYDALPQSNRASKAVSMLRAYGVYPKEGNALAQRLRPCPGCSNCAPYNGNICDGSGVQPARKKGSKRT